MYLSLYDGFNNKLIIIKSTNELPVSRNFIKRRIIDLDQNISFQLLEHFQKSNFFQLLKMRAQILLLAHSLLYL